MSPEKRRENHRLLLTAPFAFYVINFEPIEVQTCSAPQNDHPNLSSVKDIGSRKFARNGKKLPFIIS